MVQRDLVVIFALVALDQPRAQLGVHGIALVLPDLAQIGIVGALGERVLEGRRAPQQAVGVDALDADQLLVVVVLRVVGPVLGIGAGLHVPIIPLALAIFGNCGQTHCQQPDRCN
ncbi:hypothetical protein BGP84_16645 [Pseudomonas putida]|uniref:Uncharacterized protein n=1 Tax=Pseudomonas putida TaxID=303 RepID=A0A2S3X746_PSEPU|nr:hypothetical protein BGP84_16645 [Pseudomonas putida]